MPHDALLEALTYDDRGLVSSIIVDDETGRILVLCYMDREALTKTLETGFVHVYRRSRGKVMKKGETSGHLQHVRGVEVDCDADAIIVRVTQDVAACHTGYYSCFYRRYNVDAGTLEVADERVFDPDNVY